MAANFSIDEYKSLKVVVVGAGISGIYAGIRLVLHGRQSGGCTDARCNRFRQKIQNLDLTIYERHEEVGGTWWANKYP